MIKAVIFDMDGVIVDSESTHVKIERELILQYGGSINPEFLERFCGTTDSFFWQAIVKEFDLKVTPKHLSDEKNKRFIEKIKDLNLFPGVYSLIENIKEKKIKLALASSSRRNWIDGIITSNKLHFDYVVSGESLHKPKPQPDIFLDTAKHLQLDPASCLVIEDSINGVQAAKSAGMICVAVTNTFPRGKLSQADYIINNLNEFDIKWLE